MKNVLADVGRIASLFPPWLFSLNLVTLCPRFGVQSRLLLQESKQGWFCSVCYSLPVPGTLAHLAS